MIRKIIGTLLICSPFIVTFIITFDYEDSVEFLKAFGVLLLIILPIILGALVLDGVV